MTMICLKKSQIPEYLRGSEFFLALNDDDEDTISVPAINLKLDTLLSDLDDVTHLLSTLRYWGVVQVLTELIDYCISDSGMDCTAIFDPFAVDLPYLKVLLQIQHTTRSKRMIVAIKSGELVIIKSLMKASYTVPDFACNIAAEFGHLELLQFFDTECNCKCSVATSVAAAYYGKLDCLRYVLSLGFTDSHVCVAACTNGHRECLRYAHTHDCKLTDRVSTTAIINNHYDCFVYAHEYGSDWAFTLSTLTLCAEHGRIDMFTYAIEHGCPSSERVCHFSAEYGRLNQLTYAREHGVPWDASTLQAAVKNGHLDCLQYAHEQGCPWSERVCYLAAEHGHIDCLSYAVQQGCPYELSTLTQKASSGGSVEVILFVQKLS